MLPVDLQHFIKTPGGNECVGVLYDRRHVVVDVSQLRRQIAGFRHSSTLDIGLQEGAEPIRVGVEIGYFFQILDCARHIARIQRAASAEQQCIAVARIELQHALHNFFNCVGLTA